jgi:imidazolonepropionase-like amidohydrolase
MASFRVPAILCAALVVATSAQQPSERRLAITHTSLIDVVTGTLVPDVTVVIADDRIVSVDPGRTSPPEGAEAIDGRGRYVIPGLWDMHVHLWRSRTRPRRGRRCGRCRKRGSI